MFHPKLAIVILAAGQGSRMHSAYPKALQQLAGQPLLTHVLKTARQLQPGRIIIVAGKNQAVLQTAYPDTDLHWAHQPQAKGTGDAVRQSLPALGDTTQTLVLFGDVPLVQASTLHNLVQQVPADNLGLLTATIDNPQGFGRVQRDTDQRVCAIIEQKDATPEQHNIREIFSGILLAPNAMLRRLLPLIDCNNAQNEYYLPALIPLARQQGVTIADAQVASPLETQGINTPAQLAHCERAYQQQQAYAWLDRGVRLADPQRFDIRGEVEIATDVFIDINVILSGRVKIGKGCQIGPGCVLHNVTLGEQVILHPFCHLSDTQVESGAQIGPYARLRQNCHVGSQANIGNFVELKQCQFGAHSKAAHLSYLGNATLGQNVNIGAGTITCNYDGAHKYDTYIEDHAFVGSGSQLVAPLTIEHHATIGAGSTITKTAPAAQLTLARSRQTTVRHWQRPTKQKKS